MICLQGAPSRTQALPELPISTVRPAVPDQATSASDDLAEVKKRVALLEQELADSERTHQLRSVTTTFPSSAYAYDSHQAM